MRRVPRFYYFAERGVGFRLDFLSIVFLSLGSARTDT